MTNKIYDIIIVGSGLTGLTIAAMLDQPQLKIGLIDPNAWPDIDFEKFDIRSTTFSYASVIGLKKYGLWDDNLQAKSCPIKEILVHEENTVLPNQDLRFKKDGFDHPMGYVLSNGFYFPHILDKIKNQDNLTRIEASVVDIIQDDQIASLITQAKGKEKKIEIRARLVIAADGKNSFIRQKCGINASDIDYDQTAFITTLKHEKSHQFIGYESFRPQGPIAVLPQYQHQDNRMLPTKSGLVWVENHKRAHYLAKCDKEEAESIINAVLQPTYGHVKICQNRFIYPLKLSIADRAREGRIVFMGDAAHTIHPIAGQGFNLTLRSLFLLREHIDRSIENGTDFAYSMYLDAILSEHAKDVWQLTNTTHYITKLFSNDSKILKALRKTGLYAVNKMDFLKRQFVLRAMGFKDSLF